MYFYEVGSEGSYYHAHVTIAMYCYEVGIEGNYYHACVTIEMYLVLKVTIIMFM